MYARYAVYFLPDGVWGDIGAAWLGWDCRSATEIAPRSSTQAAFTERPRKYGFHATMKAPFRLAEGMSEADLLEGLQTLCTTGNPIALHSLQRSEIGSFFAYTAPGEQTDLTDLASRCVDELDRFRAPLTEAELERRRASRLTAEQDAALLQWGYPYVMDFFRFHLTLTGPIRRGPSPAPALDEWFAQAEKIPLSLDSLSLAGERPDGRFEQISRVRLGRVHIRRRK
jgi:hypothetical protein